jgi:exopolyphosphatase/guanosine-5'-triphosphate,3'-diphosphate pyrophosphatase
MSEPTPKPVRRAVIDVGTNSVKLLIADVAGCAVIPVIEGSEQTRLGSGFFEDHQLRPGPIAETAKAVAEFLGRARKAGVDTPRVIATSAAREAKNSAELTAAIEQATGLTTEVISGVQEADWVFQGVTSDPALSLEPLLLLDVGGGSTEFIVGQGDRKHFSQSFQMGTVRLLERSPHSDPPKPHELAACRKWIAEFLEKKVRPKVEPALRREQALARGRTQIKLVGTGGTSTILARMEAKLQNYDRKRIEAVRLSRTRVTARVNRLWNQSIAERRLNIGLPRKRADVILFGAAIYEGVMAAFAFQEFRVSTRGLRFAAVMDK